MAYCFLACVAGVPRGGRGENEKREARSEGDGGERLQGRYCFLRFLRPRDERKNPDWSELIKYSINCSNWSLISHSSTLASSQLHSTCTRQMNREAIVFSVFKRPLHSLEENGFKCELKVKQWKAIGQLFERKDLPAVWPTSYRKSLIFGCACWLREEPKLEILHGTWH